MVKKRLLQKYDINASQTMPSVELFKQKVDTKKANILYEFLVIPVRKTYKTEEYNIFFYCDHFF